MPLKGRVACRSALRQQHDRFTGPGLHVETVHQAASPHDAAPEPGSGSIAAVENGRQLGDAGATIDDPHRHRLREVASVHAILDPAASGVSIGVACDFADCGRDPHLVLRAEAERFGEPPRPLAHCNDVVLRLHQGRDDGPFHEDGALATNTVASSRTRAKSR